MTLSSYEFILIFLPVTIAGFWFSVRIGGRVAATVWLIMTSMSFCACAGVKSLAAIVIAVAANYLFARAMLRLGSARARLRKVAFTMGICVNITLLIYFKHEGMFLDFFNTFSGTRFDVDKVILPLGVSFLTFQMIGFLADVYQGHLREIRFLEYLLFALFFPRAVAGPIIHYREVVPQFAQFNSRTLLDHAPIALCLFSIGLFKKSFIADSLAPIVTQTFDLAPANEAHDFTTAWYAMLAVSLQIYFDFSGYTDMALGVARLFGVQLPINFNSPFKATSIAEHWRRSHITLTRFLTQYVYVPLMIYLTQSRLSKGLLTHAPQKSKRIVNVIVTSPAILITTTVSGLWHATRWQFLLWGAVHGVYLIVNQLWRTIHPLIWDDRITYERVMKPVGWVLTFVCTLVAVVFFRANSVDSALSILKGAAGLNSFFPAEWGLLNTLGIDNWSLVKLFSEYYIEDWGWLIALVLVVTLSPNTMELLRTLHPDPFENQVSSAVLRSQSTDPEAISRNRSPAWSVIRAIERVTGEGIRLNVLSATLIALLCALGILALNDGSKFIYAGF